MSRCFGGDRDPDLGVPAALGLAGFAPQPSGVLKHRESAFDLAALLVAAEHVRYLGPRHAIRALPGGGPDLIGGQIAEAVAEDPGGGVGAVAPDRESSFKVLDSDLLRAVQQRVDQRETNDVRLRAGGSRARKSRPAS